ncbi:MAG: SDR family oxidoreductase [Verrucomicrobiota bacterium]
MSKTFLIVGGNSGMARATVSRLVDQGHEVICAARTPGEWEMDSRVSLLPFRAEDPEFSGELPGQLDGMAYFPGTIQLKPFRSLKDEDFRQEWEINFLGAVRVLRAAYGPLKKAERSSVVLFSTVAVQTGMGFHASIASAKGAVEGLTRSLAAEWSPTIRVNAIAPSLTDTPLASSLLDTEAKREAAEGRHPSKSVGSPEELAELVTFLLGDGSQFLTGQILPVDGGLSSVKVF